MDWGWSTILKMKQSLTRAESPRWVWVGGIWTGIALFDATETVLSMHAAGMHHAWLRLLVTVFLSWLPWALVTPLALRLGRRYPPVRMRPASTWLVHAGVCVGADVVAAGWMAALQVLFNPMLASPHPGPFSELWFDKFSAGLLTSIMLYGAILAVGHIVDARERLARQQTEAARLNEQLSKAQLEALRRQIEPHFLFNTLNAIAGLVREQKNDAAVTMIVRLSEFLRRVVKDSGEQLVPLAEEMEFVEKYLEIQKVRFAERLQLKMEVPRELLPAKVPSLMLQPVVENAIQHGIAKRAQGGAIRISAARDNGRLTIQVYNDGPGLAADWERTRSGVGISNVRTRLQSLYGGNSGLEVQNREPGGVEATLSLPFEER